jgi:hypothetical protein
VNFGPCMNFGLFTICELQAFYMNFKPFVNFGSEFEFWVFYNFGPSKISLLCLTNNVSGYGSRAKPMGRPSMVCTNHTWAFWVWASSDGLNISSLLY